MKQTFTFISIILFSQLLLANTAYVALGDTSEFKIGDTWTYSDWIDDACEKRPIFQYSIVSDSTIGNRLYSVLAVKENDQIIEESKILLYKKENKIHFYEYGVEYLLYDFTLKVGDSLKYYIPSNVNHYAPASFNNTSFPKPEVLIIIGIDSVKTVEGQWLKKYQTDIAIPYPYAACNTMRNCIEDIGSENGLFGFPCSFVATGCYGGLRCFNSEGINLNLTNEACLPSHMTIDSSVYSVGDRWLFSPHSPTCSETIVSVDVVRDTLISNRLCNIIGVTNNGKYIKESELPIFYHDSIVSFYEEGQFKMLYNFHSKEIGDTVEFFLPKNSYYYDVSSTAGLFSPANKAYKYTVVSKSSIVDDNVKAHALYEVRSISSAPCFELGREIIEGIGSSQGLFGRACTQFLAGCGEYFRCFNGNQFTYNALSKDCETTAVNDVETPKFSIAPNPSYNSIEIKCDVAFDKIIIYGAMGNRKVMTASKSGIDVSDLANGLYVVELQNNGKTIGVQKLIKCQ